MFTATTVAAAVCNNQRLVDLFTFHLSAYSQDWDLWGEPLADERLYKKRPAKVHPEPLIDSTARDLNFPLNLIAEQFVASITTKSRAKLEHCQALVRCLPAQQGIPPPSLNFH
jgi:hypothetical protein